MEATLRRLLAAAEPYLFTLANALIEGPFEYRNNLEIDRELCEAIEEAKTHLELLWDPSKRRPAPAE